MNRHLMSAVADLYAIESEPLGLADVRLAKLSPPALITPLDKRFRVAGAADPDDGGEHWISLFPVGAVAAMWIAVGCDVGPHSLVVQCLPLLGRRDRPAGPGVEQFLEVLREEYVAERGEENIKENRR